MSNTAQLITSTEAEVVGGLRPQAKPLVRRSEASLLEQIQIKQEPRGLLGRFYIAGEQALRDMGYSASLHPIEALVDVYEAHEESWNGLVPLFDSRYAPIPVDQAACMFLYDRKGDVVGTAACRFMDLGERSIAEAAGDLSLFYGSSAPKYRRHHRCDLSATSAHRLSGPLMYYGALWIRPDHRRSGACTVFRELSRYYAVTQWRYSHEFSIGGPAFHNKDLQRRYAYSLAEPSLWVFIDGRAVMRDGLLLGVPHRELLERLPRLVDGLGRTAQIVDRDEKRVAAG